MGDLYGQQVRLTHTKNKKAQIITLGTLMVPVLEKYIRKFRADSAGKDYLFPNVYNEKLTVNALQESIKDYNHARGVNKTGIHDLRKTYTTMALASGKTTEQEVADRLGHGNTSLLKKYAQFSQAQKLRFHDASSPLNELIAPKKPRIGGR
jgi:integrase/recombinase XerD